MPPHGPERPSRRPTRRPLPLAPLLLTVLTCCRGGHSFGEASSTLNCLEMAPPDPPERLGSLRLRRKARTLHIERPSSRRGAPWRIVLAAGPAPGDALDAPLLEAIAKARPDLLVLLGDVGDGPEQARRTVTALSKVSDAVLLLPGGRDDPSVLAEAVEATDGRGVLSLTGWHHVLLEDTLQWDILPGALEEHTRRDAPHCVVTPDAVARNLREAQEANDTIPRRLLTWEAPFPLTRSDSRAGRNAPRCGGEATWPHTEGERRTDTRGCLWMLAPSLGSARRRTTEGALAEPSAWLLSARPSSMRYERIARTEKK